MKIRQNYTSGQAAKLCGLGLSTIKRWVNRGGIRAYRTPGGDIRILHEDLLSFMKEYGIPVQHLERHTVKVLLSVGDAMLLSRLSAILLREPERFATVTATNSFDTGFVVASERPRIIVTDHCRGGGCGNLCRHLRRCMVPERIRIGVLLDDRFRLDMDVENQPDAVAITSCDDSSLNQFINELTGFDFKTLGMESRRAG